MDQNSLFELTAEYGEVYGTALPRDSYLLKVVDYQENWIRLSYQIGSDRANALTNGLVKPEPWELKAMIRWQVDQALDIADTSVTPIIWLCHINDTGDIVAIESWDHSMDVELKFRFIGRFKNYSSAIEHLHQHYIFDALDI